jgi:hypothetical protein
LTLGGQQIPYKITKKGICEATIYQKFTGLCCSIEGVFPLVKFCNDSDTFLLALATLGSATEEIALFEVAKQINSLSLMYSPNKCRQCT